MVSSIDMTSSVVWQVLNSSVGNSLPSSLKVKMTQIYYLSRNQSTSQYCKQLSTFEYWLELAWLGAKCKGKTLLVIEIFFTLHRWTLRSGAKSVFSNLSRDKLKNLYMALLRGVHTALSQSSIGAQYSKQNMIEFSQCLAELVQKFKFL